MLLADYPSSRTTWARTAPLPARTQRLPPTVAAPPPQVPRGGSRAGLTIRALRSRGVIIAGDRADGASLKLAQLRDFEDVAEAREHAVSWLPHHPPALFRISLEARSGFPIGADNVCTVYTDGSTGPDPAMPSGASVLHAPGTLMGRPLLHPAGSPHPEIGRAHV